MAITSLAARSARRVLPMFEQNWPDAPAYRLQAVQDAVSAAEAFACAERAELSRRRIEADFAAGKAQGTAEAALHIFEQLADTANLGNNYVVDVATAAALAAKSASAPNSEAATQATERCLQMVAAAKPTLASRILADFRTLQLTARAREWTDQTPISPRVYALNGSFNTEAETGGHSFGQICENIDTELANYYTQNPTKLYKLTTAAFREVIDMQLEPHGWQIEFHARTRSGSHDIAGVVHPETGSRQLMECKALPDNHRIDIKAVMSLHGTTVATEHHIGLMVTTSRHAISATGTFERSQWLLATEDFHALADWLVAEDERKLTAD